MPFSILYQIDNHPSAKHPTATEMAPSKTNDPATQEENFTYPRLKNAKNNFRLVKVEGAEQSEATTPITCKMEVLNIKMPPTYAVLSFPWQTSQTKRPITINGKRHEVNAKLHQVLQGLRETRPGTWCWVNELCVDPASPQEMEQQVLLVR
jgi:hypothetical protein